MGGHFDIASKRESLKTLEAEFNDPALWNNPEYANELAKKISNIKKDISKYDTLLSNIDMNMDMLKMPDIEDEYLKDITSSLESITKEVEELEVETLLDGEFDNHNCYLEIHPGAGGTESCDWSDMLLRMYTMFLTNFGYKYQVIDKQKGEEAGIKSVMLYVEGDYAYGYLKSEIGVHRLVRISPFDSNARRHTSFAAVNVTPEITDTLDIVIKDEDIRVDVYRSSGNGGQGVNTTDSAVRITHLPSGIVVTVQNERSQIKNKEIALSILKSKLKKIELDKRNAEIYSLKGNDNINFGSQIRNYVLEPYSLVKDLRTNYESNMPLKVLDGDLYPFIEAFLRLKGDKNGQDSKNI